MTGQIDGWPVSCAKCRAALEPKDDLEPRVKRTEYRVPEYLTGTLCERCSRLGVSCFRLVGKRQCPEFIA